MPSLEDEWAAMQGQVYHEEHEKSFDEALDELSAESEADLKRQFHERTKNRKPSDKMLKAARMCEEILGIKCSDTSFAGVHEFLDENLPKIKGKDVRDVRKPSDKMLSAIAIIEQRLGITFEGKSMKEASEFIGKYYNDVFNSKKGGKKCRK